MDKHKAGVRERPESGTWKAKRAWVGRSVLPRRALMARTTAGLAIAGRSTDVPGDRLGPAAPAGISRFTVGSKAWLKVCPRFDGNEWQGKVE